MDPKEALRATVNRCLAEGAPLYVEQRRERVLTQAECLRAGIGPQMRARKLKNLARALNAHVAQADIAATYWHLGEPIGRIEGRWDCVELAGECGCIILLPDGAPYAIQHPGYLTVRPGQD